MGKVMQLMDGLGFDGVETGRLDLHHSPKQPRSSDNVLHEVKYFTLPQRIRLSHVWQILRYMICAFAQSEMLCSLPSF